MIPKWSAGVLAAVVAASSLLLLLPMTHAATGIVGYVPITLTNSQVSATPNPFQQKITWNPSSYSTYEASDLGNIRFCSDNACTTTLNAWLESCTSSCVPSATSASAWVKLASSIAGGGGTLTIYMTFLSTSTHFDGNYWGEAPTIPATYGTNDNGANVFNFYDNFAGTSLSSKWTTVKSAGGSVTVNNGATITTSSGNDYAFVVSATQTPQVAEAYMASAGTGTDLMMGVATGTSANTQVALASGYEVDNNRATGILYLSAEAPAGGTLVTSTTEAFAAGVWQMTWSATGAESASDGSITLTGTSSTPPIANYGIYIGQSTQAAGNDVVDWGRMRALPPGGVTPTAAFGTLVSISTTTTSTSSTTTSSTTSTTSTTTTTTTTSSSSTSSTSKTTTSSTTSSTATTTTSSTSTSATTSKTTPTTTSSITTTTSTSTKSALTSTSSQTGASRTTTSIASTSTDSTTTAGGGLAPILGIDPMLLGGVALAGGAAAVAVVFIRRRSSKLIPT